ncbi:peroxiredoxin [Asticcacaulis solisilvae]|uniref:peroxiredoxin n=1 Tax=Asticcacaulis solisilvae TaxID=1217274 RepID=UPI003FD760CE
MKRFVLTFAAMSLVAASPALAALKVGDTAPVFKRNAATDGKVDSFSLADALKSGPVVVYFYPKAFTGGCSLEAHQFSEAVDKFKTKHVTVVGVSTDDMGTLQRFSAQTCQGKFTVVSDLNGDVTKSYDAQMAGMNMANRISYVVGQDGKIAFVHADGDASTHVPALLKAVGAD